MSSKIKTWRAEKALIPAMGLNVALGAWDLFQMAGGFQFIEIGTIFFDLLLLTVFVTPYFLCQDILKTRVLNKFSEYSAWFVVSLLTISSLFVTLGRFFPGHKSDALDSLVYLFFPFVQMIVFGSFCVLILKLSKRY